MAVHPSDRNDVHEFYLMSDDVEAFVAEMAERGIGCGPVQDQGWGRLTQVTLPGGGSWASTSRATLAPTWCPRRRPPREAGAPEEGAR